MVDQEIRYGMSVQTGPTSDYVFRGWVVAKFEKMNGKLRYVVENVDRVLHIFSAKNLEPWNGLP